MTKNIEVVDEFGVSYGVTYPKRAKGLVKNGRARYENDEKIILTRPPEHFITEGITMSENTTKAKMDGLESPRPPEFTPNENTAKLPEIPEIVKLPQIAASEEPKAAFSYELAERSYKLFINTLPATAPGSFDSRPEQARIMFEKLFRLESAETETDAKIQAFRNVLETVELMNSGADNLPLSTLIHTFYKIFGHK